MTRNKAVHDCRLWLLPEGMPPDPTLGLSTIAPRRPAQSSLKKFKPEPRLVDECNHPIPPNTVAPIRLLSHAGPSTSGL